MRIRSIKPEFWRSEDVARLDWHTRLLFIGLWSYVDDNGVGRDSAAIITAELFALDEDSMGDRESLARVHRGLEQLSAAGLIDRYEVDDRAYLSICTWSKHQRIDRPSPARYPTSDQAIAGASRTAREPLASGSRLEQRNRGTEEQRKEPSSPRGDAAFAEFYMAYPRKVGKEAARKAWAKAIRRSEPSAIVAGAQRFAADPNLPEKQFVPHPASWLNAGRWDDEPLPSRDGAPSAPRVIEGQEWMTR